MSSCAICLNPIRKTRSTSELPCGHLYHKNCIQGWENRGNDTCPLCRQNMSRNNFRVTLTIENLRKDRNTTLSLSLSDIQEILDRMGITPEEMDLVSTDIVFDIDDLENLRSIVSDFGVRLADIDPSVLNTE